jgi:hypothetical protein
VIGILRAKDKFFWWRAEIIISICSLPLNLYIRVILCMFNIIFNRQIKCLASHINRKYILKSNFILLSVF